MTTQFYTPPSCKGPPLEVSYCEDHDAHNHHIIFRRTVDLATGERHFDQSPFPIDEDFVFDPATVEPEHPELTWQRLSEVRRRPMR